MRFLYLFPSSVDKLQTFYSDWIFLLFRFYTHGRFFVILVSKVRQDCRDEWWREVENSKYNLHQTIAQSRRRHRVFPRLLTQNKPQIMSHFTAVLYNKKIFVLNILRFIYFLLTVFAKKIKNTKCSN